MKAVPALLFAALLVTSLPAQARKLNGVELPERAQVEGQELKLQGAGLRSKWFIDVYVIGLYTADPARDPLEDQARQVRMVMLRDLGKDKVADAIIEGFEKNSKAQMPKLKARLDKLIGSLTDTKKGERLVLTYLPQKGTQVTANGKPLVLVEGRDFADALFKVWLGKDPVDGDLKAALLGKAK